MRARKLVGPPPAPPPEPKKLCRVESIPAGKVRTGLPRIVRRFIPPWQPIPDRQRADAEDAG